MDVSSRETSESLGYWASAIGAKFAERSHKLLC